MLLVCHFLFFDIMIQQSWNIIVRTCLSKEVNMEERRTRISYLHGIHVREPSNKRGTGVTSVDDVRLVCSK
jgi:hypothetical protein